MLHFAAPDDPANAKKMDAIKLTRRQMMPFLVRLPPAKAAIVIESAKAQGVSRQAWLESLIPSEAHRDKKTTGAG